MLNRVTSPAVQDNGAGGVKLTKAPVVGVKCGHLPTYLVLIPGVIRASSPG